MKARIGICLAVLLMASAFAVGASAQSTAPAYLKAYEAPRTKIRAGFIPYKTQLVFGEPLQLTFSVESLGPTNFEFEFGGDYRGTGRHDRFKIAVTNITGQSLPDPIAHPMNFGGFVQHVNLKPGQFFTNVIDLIDFRIIDKPGVYTVSCSFAFDEPWVKKEQTNPVVNTTFKLTILERTPERVAKVIDELVAKAQAIHGQDLSGTLTLIAHFGRDAAVPRLARLAESGSVELRAAALGALSLIPTDASLDVVLMSLKDSDSTIRAAAASSLGAMQKPRAVEALLDSLPREKSPVSEAIVLALGTSKSDRAFPVITNTLDAGEIEMQRTAINALVNFGGSNVVAVLQQHINTNYLSLRYEIVLALAEKLHQPMQAEWLLPVLVGREESHEWLDSLRLLRMYASDQAIPALLSYLDFDVAWSGRNWWILNEVQACPNTPHIEYDHDPNSDGTPEQWEKNLHTLQELKSLAGPIPASLVHPKVSSVPYLKTDPPIDFTPTFKEIEAGGVEIKSGFLTLTLWRGGANLPYSVSGPYHAIYQNAGRFRLLPNNPDRCAELKITPEQLKQLNDLLHQFAVKLCGSRISDQKIGNLYNLLVFQSDYCPSDDDWTSLLFAYKEAPAGPLQEQAKADLIDSVRVFSQNYHAGTVEFAEAAKKIFTAAQLEEILR
jgi:HEAT repeat protein